MSKPQAREIEFEILGKNDPLPRPSTTKGAEPPESASEDSLVRITAKLMDNVFKIPGTDIRLGFDALLTLLPGMGAPAATLISVGLLLRSSKLGVPRIILARMVLNLILNSILGAVPIPIVGSLLTVAFRSNQRNYELLQKYAGTSKHSTKQDWIFVLGMTLLLALLAVAGVFAVREFLHLFLPWFLPPLTARPAS